MGEMESGAASSGGSDAADADSPARPGFLTRLFRRDVPEDPPHHARDRAASSSGAEIVVNLRRIRRMRVEEVSTPRAEIVAVPEDIPLSDLVEVFQANSMSRLPVYAGELDHPKGLVHFKDFALRYGFGADAGAFDLESLLRPLLYVPPSMPIGVLLRKMQADRIHMALVIDEYGGVDGLVTIEDLIEEIVGEIDDEHDDEALVLLEEEDGVFAAPGRMDLDDFEEATGVRLADPELAEEVDTLGGLLFRLAGRVPAAGEEVAHPDGHVFEVIDADSRRVNRLRARLKRPETGDRGAEAAE
jgi:magnesium and cobalt transporter